MEREECCETSGPLNKIWMTDLVTLRCQEIAVCNRLWDAGHSCEAFTKVEINLFLRQDDNRPYFIFYVRPFTKYLCVVAALILWFTSSFGEIRFQNLLS